MGFAGTDTAVFPLEPICAGSWACRQRAASWAPQADLLAHYHRAQGRAEGAVVPWGAVPRINLLPRVSLSGLGQPVPAGHPKSAPGRRARPMCCVAFVWLLKLKCCQGASQFFTHQRWHRSIWQFQNLPLLKPRAGIANCMQIRTYCRFYL